jgi:multiple sugar transport system ATP-binding protein
VYQIEIDHLCKSYGPVKILKNISLNVEKGSFVALIGPSGCGKSTLLRLVAGLEKITSGAVKIAGQVVNDWPPRERHVAMVFQSYALYPHMTVARNLTYALRLRRRPKQEIAERAAATGELLGLSDLLDRMPRDLSGGQRQRVAMGRAIVRDPQVFLFDEPLSNLDAALRVRMRSELRKLHQRLGATSVYVTHDQIEAMTMADTVVVLRDGVVEQVGAPLDLYHRPAKRFVAGFIGSPAMNFVEGMVTEDGRGVVLGHARQQRLELPRPLQSGRKVWIGLRPEHLQLGGAGKQQSFDVQVDTVESTGSMTFIETEADPTSLIIAQSGTAEVEGGTTITVGINSEDIYLFDIQTDLAL